MDNNESDILIAYALRFDGYAHEFSGDSQQDVLRHELSLAVEDGIYPEDPIIQLRCLFSLQRYLCKWGGETLPECSAEWRAYRMLFLMTALAAVPEDYRHPERYGTWVLEYEPDRHKHIAIVAGVHHRTRYLHPSENDEESGYGLVGLYFDEDYLIGKVGHYFRAFGTLSAADLFSIIIWKANRAKTKLAAMLLKRFPSKSLDEVAAHLAVSLRSAKDDRERLRVLMENFGFQLPMASAILTILYPDLFTVFDVRVCEALKIDEQLLRSANSSLFSKVWPAYCDYCERVRATYPRLTSLRDKDRALWAMSARKQLQNDVAKSFRKP